MISRINVPRPTLGVGSAIAEGFVKLLDVRVPTSTPNISDERRQEILDSIQPGDIILETDNGYPGWQRLEYHTMRSSYTHTAIYEGNGKFLEATTPNGVQRSDLKEYLKGPMMLAVIRPTYKTPQDKDAALDYCRSQLGKKYNSSFNMEKQDQLYCAEMVYYALKAMPNPQTVPLKHFLGRPAVAPDSFLELANSTRIIDDGSSYWKNRLHNWPAWAPALAGGIAAGHFGGALAGVVGFLGTGALAICIGNKIQTGHFNFAGAKK